MSLNIDMPTDPSLETPQSASSLYSAVRIYDGGSSRFGVPRAKLDDLVKEKSVRRLEEYGGVSGVISALKTNGAVGIQADDGATGIQSRLEVFGTNNYLKPRSKGFCHFAVKAFDDPFILIMLAFAALSLGFGIKENGLKEGWHDGGSIFLLVFLSIVVPSAINFWQHRELIRKLSQVSNEIQIRVIRSGQVQQVSVCDIVAGDVIWLKVGDQVPADGLILDGFCLQVDESSMNGVSGHAKDKGGPDPFLFRETKVIGGKAKMVVISVGIKAERGHDGDEQTPLGAAIYKLALLTIMIGTIAALSVCAVLLFRYFTGSTTNEDGREEFSEAVRIVSVVVAILIIPTLQGLTPFAVTLTVFYSIKKMMDGPTLVKKLSACETMGCALTACLDKTGTLTRNQMKVTESWLGEPRVNKEHYSSVAQHVIDLVQEGVSLNTVRANPTDEALLSWVTDLESGMDMDMDMEQLKGNCEILSSEAFNSETRRSGVLIRKGDTFHVHWKGAAKGILGLCSRYYDKSGDERCIDKRRKWKLKQKIRAIEDKGLRCIALAHTVVATGEVKETDLTLLGFVGIDDPCRPGAKEAVEECRRAGINVKMITGDSLLTAESIAKKCGILLPNEDIDGTVVEGETFCSYTPQRRLEEAPKIRVMARCSALDKLRLVQCLKEKGDVVAVFGDGTNDAPALSAANIGFCMGIQGTQVAKESSDIVILDDNFDSVITVLRWGRCVYNDIQKFIQVQLLMNAVALVMNVVAAVSGGQLPLKISHLCGANLIISVLGIVGLATRSFPEHERPPLERIETPVREFIRIIAAKALYYIISLIWLQLHGGKSIFGADSKTADIFIFSFLLFYHVYNLFPPNNLRPLPMSQLLRSVAA